MDSYGTGRKHSIDKKQHTCSYGRRWNVSDTLSISFLSILDGNEAASIERYRQLRFKPIVNSAINEDPVVVCNDVGFENYGRGEKQ
jgi:hypothetical protein